jgi:hypothetical protein
MGLQAAVIGLVVESEGGLELALTLLHTKGYVLKIKVLHTKPRILDLNFAIMPRHRRLPIDRELMRWSKTRLRYHG